jgi:hypothetical protein
MSDKQEVRKLLNSLRLSFYEEAIKYTYTSPKGLLLKVQELENIETLIELRQVSMIYSTHNQSKPMNMIHSQTTQSSIYRKRSSQFMTTSLYSNSKSYYSNYQC